MSCFAEVTLADNAHYAFTMSPSLTTDIIAMDNTVDLDTKKRDDRTQYLGISYDIGFDVKAKDEGPEVFLRLNRSGPYDYDTPVVVNNTLMTYVAKVKPYCNAELLPKIKEIWGEVPLDPMSLRFKGGLYTYEVGHGLALGGQYENYGMTLSADLGPTQWRFYYCWPDYSNKHLLGPYIKQEKIQGIDYEHSKSYFFATDLVVSVPHHTVQPYVGILLDRSEGRRINYFATPTHEDVLGTVGCSWTFELNDLKTGLELARNFGKAYSSDTGFQDVTHQGYMVYADASYSIDKLTPHGRFLYTSANKTTADSVTNGDTVFESGKNNAFSVYSPFNIGLVDSIYPSYVNAPLVAMGHGNGINYGVSRPSTFLDPAGNDNLILFNAGFDYAATEKLSMALEWWCLQSAERGVGSYNNVPKVLSPDLGSEIDLYASYAVIKHVTLSFLGGVFFPGAAYREERTDTGGSLFTPFVRGDGKADPAYQLELTMTLCY